MTTTRWAFFYFISSQIPFFWFLGENQPWHVPYLVPVDTVPSIRVTSSVINNFVSAFSYRYILLKKHIGMELVFCTFLY